MDSASLNRLRGIETALLPHFESLRQTRVDTPVFLIEHGLDAEHLSELRHHVGVHARLSGLAGQHWVGAKIPLAIAITETGYQYRGTGTEFWPKFAADIRADINTSERNSIRQMFESLSKRLSSAAPNDSDWARRFNIISWPIRNALAPIEIHRPLAEALARLAASGGHSLPTEDFHRKLVSIADGLWSRRLADWLKDSKIAVALCRNLLMGENSASWIEPRAAARLANDIRADSEVRNALRNARRLIRSTAAGGKLVVSSANWLVAVSILPDGPIISRLLLRGPLVTPGIREAASLAAGRSAALVIKGSNSRPVPLSSFLQAHIIELYDPLAAWAPQPLIWASGTLPAAFVEPLRQMAPKSPMLFGWKETGGLLTQVGLGSVLQPDDMLLVINPDENNTHGSPKEARLIPAPNGLTAWTAPAAACRPQLSGLGIRLQDERLVDFLSTAPIQTDRNYLRLSADSTLYMRSRVNGLQVRTMLASGKSPGTDNLADLRLSEGGILCIESPSEAMTLDLISDKHSESWQLIQVPEQNEGFLNCRARPVRPSIEDFLAGDLLLFVSAPTALSDTGFCLQLLTKNRVLAEVSSRIAILPNRIDCSAAAFTPIREAAFEATRGARDSRLLLRLDLEGLARFDFPLQPRRNSWHQLGRSLQWVDESGATVGARLSATAVSPLLDGAPSPADESDIRLWLPDIPAPQSLTVGVLTGQALLFGQSSPPEIEETGRVADASRVGKGVLAVCEAYIAWSAATAPDMLAELRRRSILRKIEEVLVGALCGEEWLRAEVEAAEIGKGMNNLLVRQAIRKGLAAGNGLPSVPYSWRSDFTQLLAAEFAKDLPENSDLARSLDEATAIALDEAINRTYSELSARMEHVGEAALEETDAGNDIKVWQHTFNSARDEMDRSPFRNLILPAERLHQLQTTLYGPMADDDLVDLLVRSHLDISRQVGREWIGSASLRTGLLLWLSPENMLEAEDWQQHISRLLSDRHTCRAIRYVALNSRSEQRFSAQGFDRDF